MRIYIVLKFLLFYTLLVFVFYKIPLLNRYLIFDLPLYFRSSKKIFMKNSIVKEFPPPLFLSKLCVFCVYSFNYQIIRIP